MCFVSDDTLDAPDQPHSFVFSPPLTRTRSHRKSIQNTPSNTPPVTGVIPPPPIPESLTPITCRSSQSRDVPAVPAVVTRRRSLGRNTPDIQTVETRRSSVGRDAALRHNTPDTEIVTRRLSESRDASTESSGFQTRRSSMGRETATPSKRTSLPREKAEDSAVGVVTRRSSLGRDTPKKAPAAVPIVEPQPLEPVVEAETPKPRATRNSKK